MKFRPLKLTAAVLFVTAPATLPLAALSLAPVIGISGGICAITAGIIGIALAAAPILIGMISFDAPDRSYSGTAATILRDASQTPRSILNSIRKKLPFNNTARKRRTSGKFGKPQKKWLSIKRNNFGE